MPNQFVNRNCNLESQGAASSVCLCHLWGYKGDVLSRGLGG